MNWMRAVAAGSASVDSASVIHPYMDVSMDLTVNAMTFPVFGTGDLYVEDMETVNVESALATVDGPVHTVTVP